MPLNYINCEIVEYVEESKIVIRLHWAQLLVPVIRTPCVSPMERRRQVNHTT